MKTTNEIFEKCFKTFLEKYKIEGDFFTREKQSDNQGLFRMLNECQKAKFLEFFLEDLFQASIIEEEIIEKFYEIFNEQKIS